MPYALREEADRPLVHDLPSNARRHEFHGHSDALHFDLKRLSDQRFAFKTKTEPARVIALERSAHIVASAQSNGQSCVAALVADKQPGRMPCRAAAAELICDFMARGPYPFGGARLRHRNRLRIKRTSDRAMLHDARLREFHAISGQKSRQRMDEYLGHIERIGYETGMLTAGATKTAEHVTPHIVTLCDGDLADRVRHVLDGDTDETVRNGLSAPAITGLARQRVESFAHSAFIERLVATASEDRWKEFRPQFSEQDVCVRDGERSVLAIGFRPRAGAGGIRTDPEARAVVMQNRASPSGDGVDRHHRHGQAHACHLCLIDTFVCAVEARDIRGGAPHIEADHMADSGFARRLRHANYAAGRTGKNRVLAAEEARRGQSAIGGHEEHFDLVAQRARDLRRIATQDGREIGIRYGCVATRDESRQRRDLMTGGDLRKAGLSRDVRCALLVRGDSDSCAGTRRRRT